MASERTIMLIDMNAFFASVEQQCNPSLRGKPVLVGGSPSKRSVVAAASYESRQYGIHSGMPLMEAIRLCPQAILVVGNPQKYVDTSRRVFSIFKDYTDLMEIYSIDECFLDVTPTQDLFGGPWEIGKQIKKRIKQELGLTCSVGIGPNKILAKLAAGMKKPDGLTEIKRDQVKDLLENLPVEKLHGIGKQMTIHLASLGIKTAGELGRASVVMLRHKFGVIGEALHLMGNGTYDTPVIPYHDQPDIKSMGHTYTLAQNTRDWNVVRSQLLRLSEMVGRRLREQGYSGRTVTLVLRYADMKHFTKRKTVTDYLDDGYTIYQIALSILGPQMKDKRAIRLVGVCVSNLVKNRGQLSLFEDTSRTNLLKALDTLNNKYGEFTVKRASLMNLETREKSHGFDGKQIISNQINHCYR